MAAQLANEKIDKMRELAALTLTRLLERPELPRVAQHGALSTILVKAATASATAAAAVGAAVGGCAAAAAVTGWLVVAPIVAAL